VIAILYGYNKTVMDVSVAEAKNRLTQLLRSVEGGESVVITRNGKPVAQLVPPPAERRKARLGGMKGRIKFLPGWDDPIDLDEFLAGRI
jgi:prevent-host-death family protein